MLLNSDIKISNIEEIDARVLQFSFNVKWTMDDTSAVIDHILLKLSAKIIEVVQGADTYGVRIKLDGYEFSLNFEEYSHACWLECATDQDMVGLQDIKRLLT